MRQYRRSELCEREYVAYEGTFHLQARGEGGYLLFAHLRALPGALILDFLNQIGEQKGRSPRRQHG
jgi:hypothetical protein